MTTLTSSPPQIIYWHNRSAEANSLADMLRADTQDGQLNLVETSDQFMAALNVPRTQLIITHDPHVNIEVLQAVQRLCPNAILVLACNDETLLSPELREAAAHLLNMRQPEKLAPQVKNVLKQSSRVWSMKDAGSHCATAMSLVQDAVVAQSDDHRISAWNAGAQRLFGWTDAEALGRECGELLTMVSGPSDAEVNAAVESAGEWSGEVSYRAKNNEIRRVFARRKPLKTNGAVVGMVEVCSALPAGETEAPHAQTLSKLQALMHSGVLLDEALNRAAKLLATAGACVIDVQNDEEVIERMACVASHPALAVVEQLKSDVPIFSSNRATAGNVLQSRSARVQSPGHNLAAYLGVMSAEHKAQLDSLTAASVLSAPIIYFDKAIGIVTLISVAHAFDESDAQKLMQSAAVLGGAIERVRSEQRLRHARDQLRSGMHYKDAFLGTVSHELRTPLQAMLGWTHLLRENQMSPADVERALNSLEDNIKAQGKIVNDLLELSRINSGKLDLAAQPIELRSLLRQTLRAFEMPAASKKISLSFGGADDAPVWVSADAMWLQRAFWNVLSNSVKFTPNGGSVSIDISSDNASAFVRVADTGMGIEARHLPRIFESFGQTSQGTTRLHPGLGVGLSIARHVIEAHGGTIEAHSEGRDKGSVFTVTLPLCAPHLQEAQPQGSGQPQGGGPHESIIESGRVRIAANPNLPLGGMRILLVEDEPDTRELVRVTLAQAGAQVTEASRAQAGLDAMRAQRFDLIVCDIGMPHEDGFSMIRKIRALPPELGARTPALALTAYASREDRLNALRAGFQMHMAKPVDMTELLLVVKSIVPQQ
ncbi:MAG TPA: ATP-binding protein [Planctomycetota bacterium]|nr:ATP-binding protein [Planctomycetota bacterium]